MSQIGDGYLFIEHEKKQNVIKTDQLKTDQVIIQSNEGKQLFDEQAKQEKQPVKEKLIGPELKMDEKLVPMSEKKQARIIPFDKAGFLRDVKKLNQKARGYDAGRLEEKFSYAVALEQLKELRMGDSKGRVKKFPSDIEKIFTLVDQYRKLNVSARENANQRAYNFFTGAIWVIRVFFNIGGCRSDIKKEHKTLGLLIEKLNEVIPKYESMPEYRAVVEKLKDLRTKIYSDSGMAAKKKNTADERCSAKWKSYSQESRKVNGVGRGIQTTADEEGWLMKTVLERNVIEDRRDWPLFAHRPCREDICQGAAGNCFFLSALAAIPSDKIRDMMLDHGDGTVTVRFFDKNMFTGKYEPVYVTVDKKVKSNASLDCLWVQVMEKAYSLFCQHVSGNVMHFSERKESSQRVYKKTISDDVIDLGYVANGGHSSEVLTSILGTDTETIAVNELREEKKFSAKCWDAVMISSQKGKAAAEIRRLKARLRRKTDSLKDMSVGVNYVEVADTYKEKLDEYANMIAKFNEELKNAKDEEVQKECLDAIKEVKLRIKMADDEIRPIKGFVYEYLSSKKRINDRIQFLMKENGLPDESQKGFRYFNAYDLIGMEKDLDKAWGVIENYSESVGSYMGAYKVDEIESKTKEGLKNNATEELIAIAGGYILKIAEAKKLNENNANVKDYKVVINEALDNVKAGTAEVTSYILQKGSNLLIILGNQNDLVKKMAIDFFAAVYQKMLDNIDSVEGIKRDGDIGAEDSLAEKYFGRLEKMVKEGQCVCIGTKEIQGDKEGTAGESTEHGMVGGHAYTVLDTEVTSNGVRLVQLRNPWAGFVVKYKQGKKGVLEAHSVKEESSGVFWIEMNHLMKHLDSIYGSGKPDVAE